MSQANVDVVLDQFAAVNERDFARGMDLYADDVVLVVHSDAFLNRGTFEGIEATSEWFGDWFKTFEPGYTFEIVETRDLGDQVFLVAAHHGRGRSSGVEVAGETGYLYTVQDGKVTRAELYRDREEALKAAGLSD